MMTEKPKMCCYTLFPDKLVGRWKPRDCWTNKSPPIHRLTQLYACECLQRA